MTYSTPSTNSQMDDTVSLFHTLSTYTDWHGWLRHSPFAMPSRLSYHDVVFRIIRTALIPSFWRHASKLPPRRASPSPEKDLLDHSSWPAALLAAPHTHTSPTNGCESSSPYTPHRCSTWSIHLRTTPKDPKFIISSSVLSKINPKETVFKTHFPRCSW